MSVKLILEEDWSEYDNKKKKGVDSRFVSCDEQWERDYIKDKIKKRYPALNATDIERAIEACCQEVKGNKPRKEFMECVYRRLKL